MRRHERVVRGFLMRLASGDADDLAQETFLRAWSRAETYGGGGRYRAWLLGIAWKTFLMNARARKRRPLGSADPAPERAAPVDTEQEAIVADALARLRPEDRAAVLLCHLLGHSHHEAAEILGFPLGSLKSRVARGTAQLLALLGNGDTP
ncbi:RNA polymerase sigma factor [Sphingosinicella sp. BN140058]|uniref:RNA polymerase sigma factor n=1 Tax=Sphingosinicella sp. BN140058 TaxID=1892855 RepID=UPI0019821AC8|nr:RNA polymerase sigma factor [Sphingosinicella sp. BN140058]